MKLHKVRLLNLNSLYGEHVIDFEKDLANAPLFLILGQTGAGKSTILDAICLSLFGQTPRLGRITGRPDTDARLVMSHGTSDCLAELEFSRLQPDGTRDKYRATWSCRRSRGAPNGNLQDPQRSLSRILEDLLISDKRKKHFIPVFNEHLDHLSVSDFQRSVLLAQGEFAAFLRADEKEKASILERLTNTDVYKRIGQRAAGRRRDVKRELEQIERRLADLQLLETHEEEALRAEFTALEGTIAGLRSSQAEAQQAAQWLALEQRHQTALEATEAGFKVAQEALDGHAEQLATLAEDKRCQVAVKPLEEARVASKTLDALALALAPLQEKEASAEAEVEAYTAKEESLSKAREEAVAAMEAARPMLEKAAGLQRIAQRSSDELAKSQGAFTEASERLTLAQGANKKATQSLAELTTQQSENQAAYEAIAHAAPLVEAYAGIAYQTDHLHELIERVDEANTECETLKKKRKSLRQKLTVRRNKYQEAEAQLAPFAARREEAHAAQVEMLGERTDFRTLRDECDARRQVLRERSHTLDDATRGFTEAAELLQEGQEVAGERATLAWELEELHPQIELKQRECAKDEEKLEADEAAFRTIERTLALDDARGELAEGKPCPLCGSPSHPYVKAHGDDSTHFEETRKQVETILELQRKALKEGREELRELDRTLTRKSTALQQLTEREQTWKKRFEKVVTGFREACALLDPDALGAWLPADGFPDEDAAQSGLLDQLRKLQADTAEEADVLSARLKAIDDLRDELSAANQALEDARKESDALKGEIHDLEQELVLREEEIEDWTGRLTDRSAKWERECQALVGNFDGFKIQLACDDFSANAKAMAAMVTAAKAALDEAAASKESYEELQRKRDALREHLQELGQAKERAEASLVEATEHHVSAGAEATRREEEHAQAEEELREVLGKESLEETQSRLQQAVELAVAAVEANQAQLTEAREARSKHKALREEKESALASQGERLSEAEATLNEVLASLSLGDIPALEALLLDNETRQKMEEGVESAHKELEHATFQRDAALQATEAHASEKPTIEGLAQRNATEWEQEASDLQAALEDQRESIGVLREKMKHHEQATELAASYTQSLKDTRESFRVWEAIDKIIGIGDGDSFKEFAQSLNLQELVDRANARLLRLNPRYTLGVATGESGEPQLNFVIRDRHHADHERPLTTLSGGETFLVSLALALALADFRRIDMPIETLLLDEGFGTLDQETLDIAMSTLRQLQQESSQQIGLISHVEMLKERIDTRIIVEKVGNGRSVLKVEGVESQTLPKKNPDVVASKDSAGA